MRRTELKATLHDVHRVCTANGIRYFVIGSAAFAGAAGIVYRPVHDVDFLYDIDKKAVLGQALIKLGYIRSLHYHPLNVFPEPLERYEKNGRIIEPRGGKFSGDRCIVDFRHSFRLVFSPAMIRSKVYVLEGKKFIGLSREALFISLEIFQQLFLLFEPNGTKRQIDRQMMSARLNTGQLRQIIKENSGLFYKKIPVTTTNNRLIMNLLVSMLKLKKRLGMKPAF